MPNATQETKVVLERVRRDYSFDPPVLVSTEGGKRALVDMASVSTYPESKSARDVLFVGSVLMPSGKRVGSPGPRILDREDDLRLRALLPDGAS